MQQEHLRWPRIRSYSGDWFSVPPEQYANEKAAYRHAVNHLNETRMLYFEEGHTGWILLDA